MKEQRTKRLGARVKPSLYKKVEKLMKARSWSQSTAIEQGLELLVSKK